MHAHDIQSLVASRLSELKALPHSKDGPTPCPESYPHHGHTWLRGSERSISDAPWCRGVPTDDTDDRLIEIKEAL